MKKDNVIDSRFQVGSLFITTIIITSLIYSFMGKFCALDPRPTMQKISFNLSADKKPVTVKVGITIEDFSKFEAKNNEFEFSGLIWFYYDPKLISREEAEDFSIDKGTVKSKTPAYSYKIGDKIISSYNIDVAFRTDLYYGYFPFEDHRISFSIENRGVSVDKMIYKIKNIDFIINSDSLSYGWLYEGHETDSGAGILQFGKSEKVKDVYCPRLSLSIDYFHFSMHSIITLLLPLFFIFFVELLGFCLDQEEFRQRLLSISIANITGLLAYKFVIEGMAPKVSYLMISDILFFMFLSISFLIFLINIIGVYLTLWQKKALSLGLQFYVIVVFFYLLNYWSICG